MVPEMVYTVAFSRTARYWVSRVIAVSSHAIHVVATSVIEIPSSPDDAYVHVVGVASGETRQRTVTAELGRHRLGGDRGFDGISSVVHAVAVHDVPSIVVMRASYVSSVASDESRQHELFVGRNETTSGRCPRIAASSAVAAGSVHAAHVTGPSGDGQVGPRL